MSLIGHLEDLGLEDLLQLLGLSQKSGVLSLRTKDGDGRIVFRAGLVCSAVARSAAGELHGLPGGGGPDTETDFDGVGQAACERVGALSEDLIESEQVGSERIDSLRREAVEAAMIRMLRWRRGDFRFEFRDSSEFADHAPMLATGLNAEPTRRARGLRVMADSTSRGTPWMRSWKRCSKSRAPARRTRRSARWSGPLAGSWRWTRSLPGGP